VVVHVAEPDQLVGVDQVGIAVRELVEYLAHRRDETADLVELALEPEHPLE